MGVSQVCMHGKDAFVRASIIVASPWSREKKKNPFTNYYGCFGYSGCEAADVWTRLRKWCLGPCWAAHISHRIVPAVHAWVGWSNSEDEQRDHWIGGQTVECWRFPFSFHDVITIFWATFLWRWCGIHCWWDDNNTVGEHAAEAGSAILQRVQLRNTSSLCNEKRFDSTTAFHISALRRLWRQLLCMEWLFRQTTEENATFDGWLFRVYRCRGFGFSS